jgi:hypothetical protein
MPAIETRQRSTIEPEKTVPGLYDAAHHTVGKPVLDSELSDDVIA